MEEKELLEIEAREGEQASKNIEEMVRRGKTTDIALLYEDKFNLGKQKVCCPAAAEVPLQMLIPIYEKVILPIPPYSSPKIFCETTGYTVDQVLEQRNKGWVEPMLTYHCREYVDLSYLDELIRISPSTSIRNQVYVSTLARGIDRYDLVLKQGESIFSRIRMPPSQLIEDIGQHRASAYPRTLARIYADLSVFGLTQITMAIRDIAEIELEKAERFSLLSWALLVGPILRSLTRTIVYPDEIKESADKFYESWSANTDAFFAPCWLADVYKNLGTTVPQTMDIDEISAVRKHSEDFVQAVKSLDDEIDKTVKERFRGGEPNRSKQDEIIAKKEEFRKRWYEDVVPTFEDISRVKKVWSVALTGSIVTSVVAVAALKDVLTVPSTMLSMLLNRERIKKLVDPAAEFLSTFFECNPIHLGFYKVQRELKKVERSGR